MLGPTFRRENSPSYCVFVIEERSQWIIFNDFNFYDFGSPVLKLAGV